MRVLAVEPGPHFSVADVHTGMVKGLRQLGHTVANLNLGDRLDFYSQVALKSRGRWRPALDGESACRLAAKGVEAAAFEFWPDVVLITSCFFIPQETIELLRSRGMRVVILFTESPYEDDGQVMRARFADLALVNDPTNLALFREVNANTHYLPHAHDPAVHTPRTPTPALASDFCFVGTGFPSRVALFGQVDWSGVDVALAGNWGALAESSPLRKYLAHDIGECIDNAAAVDLYSSAKVSANTYRLAAESERPELAAGWAMSPREVEMAACGLFFLRTARGENDEVLSMLPAFEGPEDLGEKVRWWVSHDTARAKVAEQARAAVADRTFESNARALLRLLGS